MATPEFDDNEAFTPIAQSNTQNSPEFDDSEPFAPVDQSQGMSPVPWQGGGVPFQGTPLTPEQHAQVQANQPQAETPESAYGKQVTGIDQSNYDMLHSLPGGSVIAPVVNALGYPVDALMAAPGYVANKIDQLTGTTVNGVQGTGMASGGLEALTALGGEGQLHGIVGDTAVADRTAYKAYVGGVQDAYDAGGMKAAADFARGKGVPEDQIAAMSAKVAENESKGQKVQFAPDRDLSDAAQKAVHEQFPEHPYTEEELQSQGHASADDVPEGAVPTKGTTIAPETVAPDLAPAVKHANTVTDHINEIAGDWTNAPEVHVLPNGPADIADPSLRAAALAEDDPQKAAFYHDGKVYMYADRLKGPDQVSAILFHEALGHHGLASLFKDSLDAELQKYIDQSPGFRVDTQNWLKNNPKAYENDPARTVRAAEEVLAERSEQGKITPGLTDRLANRVKQFGRKAGIKLDYSRREIHTILGMAHDATVSGAPSVVANGFKFGRTGKEYNNDNHGDIKEYLRNKGERSDGQTPFDVNGVTGQDMSEVSAAWDDGYRNPAKDPKVEEAKRVAGLSEMNPLLDKERGDGRDWAKYDQRKQSRSLNRYNQDRWAAKKANPSYDEYISQHPDSAPVFDKSEPMTHLGEGTPDVLDMGAKGKQEVNIHSTDEVKAALNSKFAGSGIKFGRVRGKSQDYIGNVNMERMDTVHDVEDMLHALADAHPLDSPRSLSEVNDIARNNGFSPSRLRALNVHHDLDSRMHAYSLAQTNLLDDMHAINQKVFEGTATDGDKVALIRKANQLSLIHGTLAGAKRSVARALNAGNILKRSNLTAAAMLQDLKENGGYMGSLADPAQFLKFAETLQKHMDSKNDSGAGVVVSKIHKPYLEDWLLEGRHAAMLSGLGTHYKNSYDNIAAATRDHLEHAVLSLVPGSGVTAAEMAGRTYGLFRAALDHTLSVSNGLETLVTDPKKALGAVKDTLTKAPEYGNKTKNEVNDAYIPVLSTVGKALHAEDKFFRKYMENAALYAEGVRLAQKEGLKHVAAFNRGIEYALDPTDAMLAKVKDQANRLLLVDRASPAVRAIETMKARKVMMTPGQRVWRVAASLAFPFIKVADRGVIRQLARSPAAFLTGQFWRDFNEGGVQRRVAIGRAAMGSALVGLYAHKAMKSMTPEQPDYKKLQAKQAGGYMANATNDGTQYTDNTALQSEIDPTDTHNVVANNVSNLVHAYKSGAIGIHPYLSGMSAAAMQLVPSLMSGGFADNAKPYMDAYEALSSHKGVDAAVGNLGAGIGGSFVPGEMRQANQEFHDTTQRVATGDKSIGDRIKGRIMAAVPGLSDKLPIRYDNYGRAMEQGKTVSQSANYQKIDNDPTVKELQRLEDTIPQPVVKAAPDSWSVKDDSGKIDVKLSPHNAAEFQHESGTKFLSDVKPLVQSAGWKNLSDKQKVLVVRQINNDAIKATKASFYSKLTPGEYTITPAGE